METYHSDKSIWYHAICQHPSFTWDGSQQAAFKTEGFFKLNRSLDGFKNPRWRQQIRDLQNATTAANGYFLTLEVRDGAHYVTLKDNIGVIRKLSVSGNLSAKFCSDLRSTGGPDLWPTSLTIANALNRATISFRRNLRKTQIAFSGLTFLGELRESIDMIRHPARGLSNLARSYLDRVKDAKKKRPKNWKKELSSLWLEQAFGWSPLLNDISNAHKAYRSLCQPKTEVISGFGKEDYKRSLAYQQGQVFGALSILAFDRTERQTEFAFVKLRGAVKREVQAPIREALETFGFVPEDFLPTAWELLPWSFLIDYFVNIGDVIESYNTSTSDVAWVDRSDVIGKEYAVSHMPASNYKKVWGSQFIATGGTGSTAKMVSRAWTRTPNVGIGFPTIRLQLPGILAPWANMTALFAQANAEIHPQRPLHRSFRFPLKTVL